MLLLLVSRDVLPDWTDGFGRDADIRMTKCAVVHLNQLITEFISTENKNKK